VTSPNNKAIVWRFFNGVVNERNLDVIDEVMVPDIWDHRFDPGPPLGAEGTRRVYKRFLDAFPDGKAERLALIEEGNLVFWHGRAHATHTGGEFMGASGGGQALTWEAMDLFHVEGGMIVERWGLHDQLGRMKQMGTLPKELEHVMER
jgi:predicted ester cyclase